MNPCTVQIVWSAEELHAYAHAREGLVKQRTCAKALQRLEDVLDRQANQVSDHDLRAVTTVDPEC